jgi:hypothetical protein
MAADATDSVTGISTLFAFQNLISQARHPCSSMKLVSQGWHSFVVAV